MKEKTARSWAPRLGLEIPDIPLPDIRDHPKKGLVLIGGLFSWETAEMSGKQRCQQWKMQRQSGGWKVVCERCQAYISWGEGCFQIVVWMVSVVRVVSSVKNEQPPSCTTPFQHSDSQHSARTWDMMKRQVSPVVIRRLLSKEQMLASQFDRRPMAVLLVVLPDQNQE